MCVSVFLSVAAPHVLAAVLKRFPLPLTEAVLRPSSRNCLGCPDWFWPVAVNSGHTQGPPTKKHRFSSVGRPESVLKKHLYWFFTRRCQVGAYSGFPPPLKKILCRGGGHLEIAPSKKILLLGNPVYALTAQRLVKIQTGCPKDAILEEDSRVAI